MLTCHLAWSCKGGQSCLIDPPPWKGEGWSDRGKRGVSSVTVWSPEVSARTVAGHPKVSAKLPYGHLRCQHNGHWSPVYSSNKHWAPVTPERCQLSDCLVILSVSSNSSWSPEGVSSATVRSPKVSAQNRHWSPVAWERCQLSDSLVT